MKEAIQEAGKLLGVGYNEVIPYYTNWFITNATVFIVFAITGMVLSFCLAVYGIKHKYDIPTPLICMVAGIIFLTCLLILVAYIPDLLNPQAAAIHQLLKDIKVGK